MSLLREIQDALANPGFDLPSVLRKCKILAARLGTDELAQWVDLELDGYPESQPIPEYRRLHINCYANFMNSAWRADNQVVPSLAVPETLREDFEQIEFRDGIAKAMRFVSDGALIEQPYLCIAIKREGRMFPRMECVKAWKEIAGSEFEQLVSAIKNRILSFVLKIEAENPAAGEAPQNSQPVPKEKVQTLVTNFFGSVGNVAQHSQDFSQTAKVGIQHEDLVRLVTELTDHLDELHLAGGQKLKVEAQVATLKAQLTDEPDHVIVQQAGRTLRGITEGAIGSLLATAAQPSIWQSIQHVITRFPKG